MSIISYTINGHPITVDMTGSSEFKLGEDQVLSNADTDITFGQEWYRKGYHVYDFLSADEFRSLRKGITETVAGIVEKLGIEGELTDLEKYHEVVTTKEQHHQVVSITNDLFVPDFGFPVEELIPRLGKMVGIPLTDIDPGTDKKLHIIVRINRPGSNDFNPPHKDIYQPWDRERRLPLFMNFWIPICGVTDQSSLPMAAGTHLLPESKILRTVQGAVAEGNTYGVRGIVEWDGKRDLERADVADGQVLAFSSHLIHGLAKNEQDDTTRVALEFRLFRKD